MAAGPGKYDELATYVREQANAQLVLIAIIGGNKGSGFSVQGIEGVADPGAMVAVLREIANQIERESS